jgi:malate dehydrogenase
MMASRFIQRRAFSASARNLSKVAVLGAAGGIGQPLSLLLKMNPLVTDLALYDIRGGPGTLQFLLPERESHCRFN